MPPPHYEGCCDIPLTPLSLWARFGRTLNRGRPQSGTTASRGASG